MKAFTGLLATATLFVTAAAAHATPYSVVSGTDFDVYYTGSAPTVSGDSISVHLDALQVAVNDNFSVDPSFNTSMFLVAHKGKLISTDYTQSFTGRYSIDPGYNASIRAALNSALGNGTFDGESITPTSYIANARDTAMATAAPYPQQWMSFDTTHPWWTAAWYSSENSGGDGSAYQQLVLTIDADLYAQGNQMTGVSGWLDQATFSFQAVDAPASPADVPEPASLALLAVGASALVYRRRKTI